MRLLVGRPHYLGVLAAALLSLTACTDPAAPLVQLPREGPPRALEFLIGSWGGTYFRLQGDTVLKWQEPYARLPGVVIDTVRTVPSPDAWRAFWASVDRAGVPYWRPRYRNTDIVDGTGWHLRIDAGGGVVESGGYEAFPDRFGDQHDREMTEDFRIVLNAFGALAGSVLRD